MEIAWYWVIGIALVAWFVGAWQAKEQKEKEIRELKKRHALGDKQYEMYLREKDK